MSEGLDLKTGLEDFCQRHEAEGQVFVDDLRMAIKRVVDGVYLHMPAALEHADSAEFRTKIEAVFAPDAGVEIIQNIRRRGTERVYRELLDFRKANGLSWADMLKGFNVGDDLKIQAEKMEDYSFLIRRELRRGRICDNFEFSDLRTTLKKAMNRYSKREYGVGSLFFHVLFFDHEILARFDWGDLDGEISFKLSKAYREAQKDVDGFNVMKLLDFYKKHRPNLTTIFHAFNNLTPMALSRFQSCEESELIDLMILASLLNRIINENPNVDTDEVVSKCLNLTTEQLGKNLVIYYSLMAA